MEKQSNTKFSVSVIIPVYNAEKFLDKTINSALIQNEVVEVLVIDDGSTDDSLKILHAFAKAHKRVKVYQHENGINKGRSATRNLGIMKATALFIAFLDADDYFLPKRFIVDKKLLQSQNIDGCYNAVGFHYYRNIEDSETKHFKLNTINKKLHPNELFSGLVKSKNGYLHLNGITVRKIIFNKTGLFNELLVVGEDTDFILKIALITRMQAGVLDAPLALRGIHGTNIFNDEAVYIKYTHKVYESVIKWSYYNNINKTKIDELLDALWQYRFTHKESLFFYTLYWVELIFKNPRMIFSVLSIKYFPLVRKRKSIFSFLYR